MSSTSSSPADLDVAAASPPGRERRGGPTDPSHDEELRRGILHTAISRRLAWGLCLVFLVLIYALPIGQALLEWREDEPSMLLDVFTRAPTHESFKQYEEDLENASYAKAWVQPRMQLALTRSGRVGNKKAVVGQAAGSGYGNWLYYAPGVLAVAGPGFLHPQIHQVRIKESLDSGEAGIHPDPRPAVLDLHRSLAARGIRLVLFPVPDKATLQPLQLHGRNGGEAELPVAANRDLDQFVQQMRAAGVLVFDPRPASLRRDEPARYLVQDTHWTPEWMQTVAGQLAGFVKQHAPLPVQAPPPRTIMTQPITRVGDVVDMLKLPENQRWFAPQTVTVRQVRDDKGEPWQPSESADVLLLGDSFTNVFSLPPMGWGESAGFAPHLALALGRELDVIAQNDSGAFATRKLLSEALGAGEDRLAGKKVVIWEFAARELSVGDWRPFGYQLGSAGK